VVWSYGIFSNVDLDLQRHSPVEDAIIDRNQIPSNDLDTHQTGRAVVTPESTIATWGHGTPTLGSFHTSDLPRIFYGTDAPSLAIQDRYISFVTSMDPNHGIENAMSGHRTYWPTWRGKRELMEFGLNATGLIIDEFRPASFDYIKSHIGY
jgi:hypothetical protein